MSKGKKQEILDFIKQHLEGEGAFPTLNEIKDNVGLKSVSTVHQHVKDLVESGALVDDGIGGYELPLKTNKSDEVEVIGYIAAGFPIEVIEDKKTTISVPSLPPTNDFYALQVKGDSMIDEGIFDGDIVVIKRQTSAQNGQTVVAIIDDNKATLKKLYKEDGKFRLQPANQSMSPLIRNEVEIRGVVWEMVRLFENKIANGPQQVHKNGMLLWHIQCASEWYNEPIDEFIFNRNRPSSKAIRMLMGKITSQSGRKLTKIVEDTSVYAVYATTTSELLYA